MSVHDRIDAEICRAEERYGQFRSSHEGFGVLAEEVSELLDAIRANDHRWIQREAIQVSAVAARIAESMDNPSTVERNTP